jgi:hypothetical protein
MNIPFLDCYRDPPDFSAGPNLIFGPPLSSEAVIAMEFRWAYCRNLLEAAFGVEPPSQFIGGSRQLHPALCLHCKLMGTRIKVIPQYAFLLVPA